MYSPEFLQFWKAYPAKTGKGAAFKAWGRIKSPKPSVEELLGNLSWQRDSERWKNGYIPNPATYLNQRRWEDERPVEPESSTGIKESMDFIWGPKR